jgi:hypothetical protein
MSLTLKLLIGAVATAMLLMLLVTELPALAAGGLLYPTRQRVNHPIPVLDHVDETKHHILGQMIVFFN